MAVNKPANQAKKIVSDVTKDKHILAKENFDNGTMAVKAMDNDGNIEIIDTLNMKDLNEYFGGRDKKV